MRIVIALAVAATLVGVFFTTRDGAALNPNIQNQFDLAMDTDPTGNTASSLGSLDPCVAVNVNDTFQVDLVVQGVPEPGAAGLEGNIYYDPAILRVEATQTDGLMLAPPQFNYPPPDQLPDTDGNLAMGFASLSGVYSTGDGVIVRLTLRALAEGGSTLIWGNEITPNNGVPSVYYIDMSDPENPDYIGVFPKMRARGAEVVVGGTCPGNLVDTDGDGFGDLYEDYTEVLAVQACAATATTDDEAFDAWPTDFDNNQKVNTTDVLQLKPVFGQPSAGNERYDLAPSDSINTTDVLALKPVFGQICTP